MNSVVKLFAVIIFAMLILTFVVVAVYAGMAPGHASGMAHTVIAARGGGHKR
jgi:hypothetical protein